MDGPGEDITVAFGVPSKNENEKRMVDFCHEDGWAMWRGQDC